MMLLLSFSPLLILFNKHVFLIAWLRLNVITSLIPHHMVAWIIPFLDLISRYFENQIRDPLAFFLLTIFQLWCWWSVYHSRDFRRKHICSLCSHTGSKPGQHGIPVASSWRCFSRITWKLKCSAWLFQSCWKDAASQQEGTIEKLKN